MTREELQPLAKQFFKLNSDVKEIFITEDKHCWYTEAHAIKHCKPDKKHYKFTPHDFEESISDKSKDSSNELTPKQKLQNEADELGILFVDKTTSKKLEELIKEMGEELRLEAIDLELEIDEEISTKELFDLIAKKKEE